MLFRRPPPRGGASINFVPVQTANIQPIFSILIDSGLCSYRDLKARDQDGQPVIDLAEVYDLLEVLTVRAENNRRAQRESAKSNKKKPP